jgi:hypothetical protein
VSETVTGAVPAMDGGWLMEQVGGLIAAGDLPVTAQVRVTVPVNPPLGVTVIVDDAVPPDAGTVIVLPLREKEGVAAMPFTVIDSWAEWDTVPAAPDTVAVYAPGVVVDFDVIVIVEVTAPLPDTAGG